MPGPRVKTGPSPYAGTAVGIRRTLVLWTRAASKGACSICTPPQAERAEAGMRLQYDATVVVPPAEIAHESPAGCACCTSR